MSESILDEIKANVNASTVAPSVEFDAEMVEQKTDVFGWIPKIFKAKSSDKPIEEFTQHPFNYDKKNSTGRIIRGLEGLLGALNYAIVDLIMGFVEKWKEGKDGA